METSVNRNALKLIEKGLENRKRLRITKDVGPLGCTIIDTGVKTFGGYAAGKWLTEVCLAGYGSASLTTLTYGELLLPSIFVETDFPAVATLGSQFAGWNINTRDYSAIGSGPARALSLKPKEMYQLIQYEDHYDSAIIILEAESFPTEEAVRTIADNCRVSPENLHILVAPASSIAGSVQISGRIVETGIHRLSQLGLDPKLIHSACGYAPIAPTHPDKLQTMSRTNDAIYYGGAAFYSTTYESDSQLRKIVSKSSSSSSEEYGKRFYEILEAAQFDFYKVDPKIFAPAVVTVTNNKTGSTFKTGRINWRILKKAMDIVHV